MEQVAHKCLAVSGASWITVDVYGDADARRLIIVSGSMSDAHEWRGVASAITAWPSVVVVNRRGRSPSGPQTDAYSVETEVEDLKVVLGNFSGASARFGWSYGGLIVLLAANELPLRQVIAYEPVMKPFGQHALPALKAATTVADWSHSVEIALRQVACVSDAGIDHLRSDSQVWDQLCRLSMPSYAELSAVNADPQPDQFARLADRVDLIIGKNNRETSPYGTAFENVRAKIEEATVYELEGQGHLAHIQAPGALGSLIDTLAGDTTSQKS
jgi:pimeloyl-ACP methyl ester carboxylesterase